MDSKPKIGLIGTVGVPGKYGGFETLAHQLVKRLNHEIDFTVYNSSYHYSAKERVKEWNNAQIIYVPFNANGLQSIIYDIVSMIHALLFCNVLLILGVSGCLFLPFVRLFSTKKVIVNIDGLEWKRNKWKPYAKKFLKFSEYMAVKYADIIICDNPIIKQYVKEEYGKEGVLIAYGAEHTSYRPITNNLKEKYSFLKNDYAFKVCRIEPENNIDMVLEAFSKEAIMPLVIVGNWDASHYGRSLKKKYRLLPNIKLYDPIYDLEILDVFRSNCSVYIHGHSAGGTNPSLVEAMYLKAPIIAFDINYNRETTHNQAFYFSSASDIKETLVYVSKKHFEEMALTLHQISLIEYNWEVISDKYYREMTGEEILVPSLVKDKPYRTDPKPVLLRPKVTIPPAYDPAA